MIPASPSEDVGVAFDEVARVATIELRRPPNNFFDLALVTVIADLVEAFERVPECGAIVLAAEGKHFCAGRDFGKPAEEGDGPEALYAQGVRLFGGTKPIVAAVNGAAVGGGFGLAMAADFRVAGPSTRFSANFAKIGYFPGFGLTATLPLVIGRQRTLDLLYGARDIVGPAAEEVGLADRYVTEDAQLRSAAEALAEDIAASAPLSVAGIRKVLRGDLRGHVEAATRTELEYQLALRKSADFVEAQTARREKRRPRFIGR